MEEKKPISEKEMLRRKGLAERREAGYRAYIERKHKEMAEREEKKKAEKEKRRLRRKRRGGLVGRRNVGRRRKGNIYPEDLRLMEGA